MPDSPLTTADLYIYIYISHANEMWTAEAGVLRPLRKQERHISRQIVKCLLLPAPLEGAATLQPKQPPGF